MRADHVASDKVVTPAQPLGESDSPATATSIAMANRLDKAALF